ncbi:hypothetical protein UPYG_G00290960 [Umbra pygmaea]|uniref:MD-2-related lipid-recognition domain-containing protein n=1 Tax=Umbra pygmaea TaxID=75934 RepID=A0ABD0WP91_UMBPY
MTQMFKVLGVVVLSVFAAFGQRKYICSSDIMEAWYTWSGLVYDFSASVSPCTYGTKMVQVNYTVIPMVEIRRFGYKVDVWYNNQKYLELVEVDNVCQDLKICNIIKGESLDDSIDFVFKHRDMMLKKGIYEIFIKLWILDNTQTVENISGSANITIDIK